MGSSLLTFSPGCLRTATNRASWSPSPIWGIRTETLGITEPSLTYPRLSSNLAGTGPAPAPLPVWVGRLQIVLQERRRICYLDSDGKAWHGFPRREGPRTGTFAYARFLLSFEWKSRRTQNEIRINARNRSSTRLVRDLGGAKATQDGPRHGKGPGD